MKNKYFHIYQGYAKTHRPMCCMIDDWQNILDKHFKCSMNASDKSEKWWYWGSAKCKQKNKTLQFHKLSNLENTPSGFRDIHSGQLPMTLPNYKLGKFHRTLNGKIHPAVSDIWPNPWASPNRLCHTEEMLSPRYEIAIDLMSYGRVSKSYVWDRCTVAMLYGWDAKSSLWDKNSG